MKGEGLGMGRPGGSGAGGSGACGRRRLRPRGVMDGRRDVRAGLGLRFVGFHLLIPFPSALLDCNSPCGSGSAGPAPSDLPPAG